MSQVAAQKTAAVAQPRKTFQNLVDSDDFKLKIAQALPKHLTPERFIRVMLSATVRTPKLLECTQDSLFKCIFDLAAIGLEPDGRRAHLIPFRAGQNTECQLIIDYKGKAELALRSGTVSSIHADTVCENDEFEVNAGLLEKHKVDYKKGDRGRAYAAYCIIRFKDGTHKLEVMSRDDIEDIRARSKGWQAFEDKKISTTPWHSDPGEMWKKTVAHRAFKWVPLSPEIREHIERADDDLSLVRNVTPTSQPTKTLSDAMREPEPIPEYTAEQRQEVVEIIQNWILDHETESEKSVLKKAKEDGLVSTQEDIELLALPTTDLVRIADVLKGIK